MYGGGTNDKLRFISRKLLIRPDMISPDSSKGWMRRRWL